VTDIFDLIRRGMPGNVQTQLPDTKMAGNIYAKTAQLLSPPYPQSDARFWRTPVPTYTEPAALARKPNVSMIREGQPVAPPSIIPQVVPVAPRGQEQARYAWQWGPPYTFPGNPPVAYDTSLKYPLQPKALSWMQGVPINLNSPDWSWYGTGRPGQISLSSDSSDTAMHELLHAWNYGISRVPSWMPARAQALDPWLRPSSRMSIGRDILPGLRQAGETSFANYDQYHAASPSEWYAQFPTRGDPLAR